MIETATKDDACRSDCAYVPRELVRQLISSGASRTEWAVIVTMMVGMPINAREIGVFSDGTPKSSKMIAKDAGLSQACMVRRALSSLVSKGIIERSRAVKVEGRFINVYRLTDMALGIEVDRRSLLKLVD